MVNKQTLVNLITLIILIASGIPLASAEGRNSYILNEIVIHKRPIFDRQKGPLSFVPSAINGLHAITRDSVIKRQIWLKPGDQFSPDDMAELERNLRNLSLFANVEVTTQLVNGQENLVDLVITTRDRLSIVFSAGGSFLGGIGEVKFSVGERNLLGSGQRLVFGYSENTEGELLGSVSYDNVLLRGSDVYGAIRVGQTEEGDFAAASLTDRFQHSRDNRAWTLSLSSVNDRSDFYEEGVSVAEVPKSTRKISLETQQRRGTVKRNWRFGPLASWQEENWQEAIGSGASDIEVPEDSQTGFIGGQLVFNQTREYLKTRWLDTLSYDQDIALGNGLTLLLGAQQQETATSSTTRPTIGLNTWSRSLKGANNYFSTSLKSIANLEDDQFSAWAINLSANWFNTWFSKQTIASRLHYRSARDDSGLPPKQSLGEDSGLRGYPAREFNGEQSLLFNLESRIRTRVRIASFDIGLLGFFDTGWVSDRGEGLGDARSSVGLGLRIGSRAILGNGIIRFDFAYPLNNVNGKDYQPTFSLALGQVFVF